MRTRARAGDCCDTEVAARAGAFGTLGCCARLKMVRLLARQKALRVSDLKQGLEVGQPTVSHHLKVLRDAGLVDVQRRGTSAYYSLQRDALKDLLEQLLEVV
jgi:ArsR family transcriptional regulator